MANSRSKARIEARIKERAAYCLEFELNDPRSAFLTVTRVEVSSDLSTAKIYYTVYGTAGERSRVQHMLQDAGGFIRSQIGRVLRTRRIPRITWIYDDSIEYAENLDRAIAAALEHDREINPSAHRDLSPRDPPPAPEPTERDYLDYLQAQEDEEDD